ncbi:MAG TPA: S9 family peptidase [Ktedonobacterales bacterium]|nr:S9 family peptidase [Ktedonobacterales bacterium]
MTRPLTPEDLYAIRLVEEVCVAPDGAQIAYVMQSMDRDTYEYRRAIWVAPVEGGEPRRLTAGPNDHTPRWSPDGRSLAFVRSPARPIPPHTKAEHDAGAGEGQIWMLPMEGGEPIQLTKMRYGADTPTWSPDSKTILFAAKAGEPEEPEVEESAIGDEAKHLPRVRTITRLLHKLDGVGYIYEHRTQLFTIPATGGEPRQLTDGDYDAGDPDWSPDGKTIVFASDRTDERWKWPGPSIWTLNLASDALTRMTDEALSCHAPKWSPDGKTIAFLSGARRHSDGHTDLAIVPANKPGKHRVLTGDFVPTCEDTCIDDMRAGHGGAHLFWSPDGHHIFFLASMRGTTHVYAARTTGNLLPRRLTEGSRRIYAFWMDHDCHHLALAASDPITPGDLYTQAIDLGENTAPMMERLTHLNEALFSEVELASPEEYGFLGADGWELQGWILRPPQTGTGEGVNVPAVLEVHGGPMAMYGYGFFMEFQLLVARGYAVIYTNPRGSTGYGRTFSAAVLNDWGGKDYEDIIAGLDAALAKGGIDGNRLGIAGGSYGGFMTNWAVGHSDRFKAAVTMRSVVSMTTMFGVSDIGWELTIDELGGAMPWTEPERLARFSPYSYVQNIHTPLLILHSDNDLRCPIAEGMQLFTALKFMDRVTEFVVFEGQSHDLSRNGHPRSRVSRLEKILDWFCQYNPR